MCIQKKLTSANKWSPFRSLANLIIQMTSAQVLAASQITIAFSGLYALTLFNQIVRKKIYHYNGRKTGKTFERYESLEMRPHDRLTANFLEWMPLFLCPLWVLASTESFTDSCINIAWSYVAVRALYILLVLQFGVDRSGNNVPLWAATFPGYACLTHLLVQSVRAVF